MIDLLKTDASNSDFVALIIKLDAELMITDGDDHEFYDQYNKLDTIKHIILAYENNSAVGCGAIKQYDDLTMEVKRMFVTAEGRGKGWATIILQGLEAWARELGFKRCILETGIRQHAAIRLYQKNNFKVIDNYGQYSGVTTSICFGKQL
jgi:GNAT superfamily N-acetyltransferase